MSGPLTTDAGRLITDACGDDELAARSGEFAQLYATTFPRIYSYVRSQVCDVSVAQEIVGRVFLKAYRHRLKMPPGDGALTWTFRIAHTMLIDYWRVEGRHSAASISLDELGDLRDEHDDPEARYATKERQALLLRGMQELSRDDRELLALKFTAERTNREIAEVLGLTEAAISMRLLRALRRLKQRLAGFGAA
jgi:RNA polymerase sigma factor (sigma-70 family)